MPQFSILMLSRGRAAYSERTLAQLARTAPAGEQLILVDDATEDASVVSVFEAFRRRHPEYRVEILRFDEPQGAVVGRNRAVPLAVAEYIVFLDNDCLPRTRGWLAGLRQAFERHPAAGIAGPMLLFPPGERQEALLIQCAGCTVSLSGRTGFRGRGDAADDARWNREEVLSAIISACWLMPRRLWDELGPLDVAFSPCQFEDIDYCYRARQAGYEVWYVPSVQMYHFENVTSGGLPGVGYAALTARNSVTFMKKWRQVLEVEGAPPPSAIEWRKDAPLARLEDAGGLELV